MLIFEDAVFILNALASTEDQKQAVSSVLAEMLAAKPIDPAIK
ncbi:hypothetical protein NTG1052_20015 [Candidatus Nitrotoga sp. 1052]|nr:hypothetical protein NTG1052_20015 [Candidatus Nitrotoga sp. 1052]